MKYEVEIGGARRRVEVRSAPPGPFTAAVDGRPLPGQVWQPEPNTYLFIIEGQVFEVQVLAEADGRLTLRLAGSALAARVIDPKQRVRSGETGPEGQQQITAPMPGKVVRLMVAAGAEVETGQGVVVVEAMKMQNELKSPKRGKVAEIKVAEGQTVTAAQVLVVIE